MVFEGLNIHSNDSELLHAFGEVNTKEKAFTLMVDKYKQRLYWHIRRMVIDHDNTDDILQNTFIRAWKGLENFRADSSIYTWLYRIATNLCLTHIDSEKKRKYVNMGDQVHQIKLQSETGFDSHKLEWKLQMALAELPDKQRIVFNLRYYDEMPYEQMSEVLGTSVGALKASYHHAAKKIAVFIQTN